MARTRKAKKRSTQAMFASTVLFLEAFVVFFAMLAIAGLSEYSKVQVYGIGLTLSLALIISCAFIRKPFGIALGWVLQIVLICGGFLMSEMFIIGILFALAWWYAVVKGRDIDQEVAQRQKEEEIYLAEKEKQGHEQ